MALLLESLSGLIILIKEYLWPLQVVNVHILSVRNCVPAVAATQSFKKIKPFGTAMLGNSKFPHADSLKCLSIY